MSGAKTAYQTIFDKLVFPKNLNHFVFWGLISILIYWIFRLFAIIFDINLHFTVFIFISSLALLGPSLAIIFQRYLNEISHKGHSIFGRNFDDLNNRFFPNGLNVFTKYSIFTAILVNILFIISLTYSWHPTTSHISKIVMIIIVQPLVFLCGLGAYFLILLIVFLSSISKLEPVSHFRYEPISIFNYTQRIYSLISLIVILGYFLLILAIAHAPFKFNYIMLVWSSVLAFYPIISVIASLYFTNDFRNKYRQRKIEIICKKIDERFEKINSSIDSIDQVRKLFELYQNVVKERFSRRLIENSWPIIISVLTILTQVFVTLATIGSAKGKNIISILKELVGL